MQQRSAIAVEDPLALGTFLERLAGLGDMEVHIATKTAEMQVATQQCEAHAAESERCAQSHRGSYHGVRHAMACFEQIACLIVRMCDSV